MGLLADLFVLLMGFALLSRHFEAAEARRDACILPGDWKGGLVLLVLVFVPWAFLDDIPAALIGGTMARHVFRGKVHIGHQAAIVAASTADCGSVVGDTTTSSDVDRRISPLEVLDAYVGAGGASDADPLDQRRHQGSSVRSSHDFSNACRSTLPIAAYAEGLPL